MKSLIIYLFKYLIFSEFYGFLAPNCNTDPFQALIDWKLDYDTRIGYSYVSLTDLKPTFTSNNITILRELGCGAFGCVFNVCYKSNCDLAMKIGEIEQYEVELYKNMSDRRIVPYLHKNFTYSFVKTLPPPNYSYSYNAGQTAQTKEIKGIILLMDRYPMTVHEYLSTKGNRDVLRLSVERLKRKVIQIRLVHGDLHLNNVMVGSDLLSESPTHLKEIMMQDEEFIPIVLIDLGFAKIVEHPDNSDHWDHWEYWEWQWKD